MDDFFDDSNFIIRGNAKTYRQRGGTYDTGTTGYQEGGRRKRRKNKRACYSRKPGRRKKRKIKKVASY